MTGRLRSGDSSWVHNAVVYGVDMARYYDSNDDGFGDLPGLIAKLDYLKGLGVDCLWLLPFYPSDRRDNGYDVTDYIGVDERFGKLDDFRDLTEQAHERGIRIMIDLVLHHTSEKHPWFQASQTDPLSRFADYYIWSQQKPRDSESMSTFPHEEDGVWEYSSRAQAFYRHKFYSFEPDLRLANEHVWDEVKAIFDFWISLGVDSFRIDAATHMFADKGVPGASASFGERLDDLRRFLADRAPGVALLGEADVPIDDIPPYTENGRFELLYNFLANNATYLSLARESAGPIAGCIQRLREALGEGSMLNFMRNLDELDLERLTDDERDEVFRAFARRKDMRIYDRGIRRGWPAMMRNDAQLHMTMSLLFAMPGIPLLMYGQEIGIGDDLTLEGRSSVRLPMQWSSERTGGFSRRGTSGITRIANPRGKRGFRRLNVEEETKNPQSLLHLTRDLIHLRGEHPEFGQSDWSVDEDAADPLLVLHYGDVIAMHNFSRRRQRLPSLPESDRLLGSDVSGGTIGGYGFAWLHER